MYRLALDTCFAACSVAVVTPRHTTSRIALMQTGHAEALMPMLRQVMGEAQCGFDTLELVMVTNGPGTFTGTRVGVATAKAVALAAGIPIAAANSLQVMGWGARRLLGADDARRHICVAVDARRDELYLQVLGPDASGADQSGADQSGADQSGADQSGAGEPGAGEPVAVSPGDALGHLPAGDIIAVGSGAAALANAALAQGRQIATALHDLTPDASDLVARPPPRGQNRTIKPFYLRAPDARAQTGKTIARAT